ncbi:MAG: OprD family outer membrane porin [Sulfuricurvum sp.]|nr:OprD family outer membrane porin [Sulfuricurvum sp.]
MPIYRFNNAGETVNNRWLYPLVLFLISTVSCNAQMSGGIFQNTKLKGQLRAFWFEGERELRSDRTALTLGGILGYETSAYAGVSGGVSVFLSNGIVPLTRMPYSGQTQNLNPDGSSIHALGEAYLQYRSEATSLKIGRQRLDLPLANDYYNRMLPNSFEALSIENRSLPNIQFKGAYITGWKYKADDTFRSPTYTYGIDRNILIAGALYTPYPALKIEVYDTYVDDIMNAPYLQMTDQALYQSSDGTTLSCAIQYLSERSTGTAAAGVIDTYLLGIKATVTGGAYYMSFLGTQIGNQSLLGTGGRYEKMGWGGFITYTDLQIDGESENAGAKAYGTVLGYRASERFEIAAKYMHIDQSDARQADAASLTQNKRPDSNEYNMDATYQPDKAFRLRTRLSRIDYITGSTALYQANAYDETNIRIIADYLF